MPTAKASATAKAATPPRVITLRGLRTHNLKGIDLDLPLGQWIVVTGVSGAGKSSLAFDTLYAEGQRRYVETFSPYARQFLDKLDRPNADRLDGIPPAIAVHRPQGRHSSRSTVATIAEIHDLLAILYARSGAVVCMTCGAPVRPASPTSVSRAIDLFADGTRYEIAYPLEIGPDTDRAALARALRSQGFTRFKRAGQPVELDQSDLPIEGPAAIDVIVDRLVRGKDAPERRLDSIETAFARGLGRCRVIAGDQAHTFLRGWRCGNCGTDHLEPQANLFRYGSPLGACSRCDGSGQTMALDVARIIPDPSRTIRQGALAPWSSPAYRALLVDLLDHAAELAIPVDTPFDHLDPDQRSRVLDGVPGTRFRGIAGFLRELEKRDFKAPVRVFLSRWRSQQPCPHCRGARLRPEALAVKIEGTDIATLSAMTTRDALAFFDQHPHLANESPSARIVAQVVGRLRYLVEIGLDYLTLDRGARTLSASELKRVALTRALGSGLVNTLYVLDEPTAGLHPYETGRLLTILGRLRDLGNTLAVVEHDHAVIRAANWVVDLGPGAGEAGGQVVFAGPVDHFVSQVESSPTARFLCGREARAAAPARRAVTKKALVLRGARGNNLKSIDVSFPLNLLCVVTGVGGAGKSTLIEETLYPALRQRISGVAAHAAPFGELTGGDDLAQVVFLDQSPLTRGARSNPVTYLKAFDEIRRTFAATHEAKLRNYDAGRFSFNVEGGRCNHCQGAGVLTVDLQFLPDVLIRCPECRGTRYRPEILEVTYRGRNIAEVLDTSVRESFGFFRHRRKVQARLRPLLDIGLDYLKLGQPLATLSGGEGQRLKLAGFLGRSLAAISRAGKAPPTLFLLDEPTAGLHPVDVAKLIEGLSALVERGHSVIVIEHNPDLMRAADWIIDLGPGGGAMGGQLVAQGTPEEVARSGTPTGQALAQALGQAP